LGAETEYPTAAQTAADRQDTLASVLVLLGAFGVVSVVQEEPLRASPIVLEPVDPTATQLLADVYETPKSLPRTPLARRADQLVPFHCAARSPGTSQQRNGLQNRTYVNPTAVQLELATHATP
jgi:hypothetical protein